MDNLSFLIKENESLWTAENEKEVIQILSNWKTGEKKSRQIYHLHNTYDVVNFAGISKVVLKKSARVVATKESVISVINDVHISIGHKGEKKTHQK